MTAGRRIARGTILVYDCLRLLFLLVLLRSYMETEGTDPVRLFLGTGLPFVMYAVPNVLFPLMALFLLIRSASSRAYVPLYVTGKTLSILCMFLWVWRVFHLMNQAVSFLDWAGIVAILDRIQWVFFLCAADVGSILGTALPEESKPPEPDARYSGGVSAVVEAAAALEAANAPGLEMPEGGE